MLDRFRFDTAARGRRAGTRTPSVWHVRTTSAAALTADVLVSAAGALSDPKLPDIDGIDSFARARSSTPRSGDHDHDLTGKRVAVIGTGASAIQIVPEIADRVAHLDVYQRTAPYVIPRRDRAYTALEKLAFAHVPGVQRAYRTAIYWARETLRAGVRLGLPDRRAGEAGRPG